MKAQLFALTLLVGVAVAGMGAGAAPGPQYIFVGETSGGEIVTVPTDHPGSGEVTCVINGHCTTGSHVMGATVLHGFYIAAGSVGTFSSTLVGDDGNVRFFGCVQNPTGFNCQGGGSFPTFGAVIEHHCVGKTAPADTTCRIVH